MQTREFGLAWLVITKTRDGLPRIGIIYNMTVYSLELYIIENCNNFRERDFNHRHCPLKVTSGLIIIAVFPGCRYSVF